MNVQWWCFASGADWTWAWRVYPGVWMFVLCVAGGYTWLARGRGRAAGRVPRWRHLCGVAGVLTLWVGLDWPVGALGAGYLSSVHAVQFNLIGVLAPALLALGVDRRGTVRTGHPPRMRLHPGLSFIVFNAVAVVTHMPATVDGLMGSAAGAFAIDLAWFAAGLAFWWPLTASAAEGFTVPVRLLYVLVSSLPHGGIAMYLLLARYPVYGTYELAPPLPGMTPMLDQALAGGVMLFMGMAATLVPAGILWFRWAGAEQALTHAT